MDDTLLKAIKKDDVNNIAELLANFNGSLEEEENLLRLACEHRSIKCALEIARLKPELTNVNNAMHHILEFGDIAIVKRLVELFPELCTRRYGPHNRTPLHIAAIRGNEEFLSAILTHSPPDSLTRQHEETAFHLALNHNHFGCFQMLIAHAQKLKNFREILNHRDHEGNTILHIATSRKQIQIIKQLLSDKNPTIASVMEVNAINEMGFTALDVHYQDPIARVNKEITTLLQGGANYSELSAVNKKMIEIMLITVWLMVFTFVAGGSYAALFNLNNIFPKHDYYSYHHSKQNIINLKDVATMRAHLPDVFYFIVLNTVTFIGSVIMILANTWSLVTTKWSSTLRAASLTVLGSMCMGYALLVNKIIPKFWVTVGGSLKISSFCFLWLFNLPVILFILTLFFAFKKLFKV